MGESPTSSVPGPDDCGLYPEGSLAHRLFFRGSFCAAAAAFTLGFSLRTAGMSRMPMHGPALLLANHASYLDPPLVGVAARRELVYLARKTLFRNRFFAGLIRAYNAVPIDQEGVGKEGIRIILDQLQMRRAVLVFPEGERTPHGHMVALKPGIHLIIKRTQAAIVPVGIAGAYDAFPRSQAMPTPAPLFWPAVRGTIAVAIGEPEEARRYAELPREQALTELAVKIDAVRSRAEALRRKT
jgi:1-acyl-sn-glycerol-3-phosphate acyltransferase